MKLELPEAIVSLLDLRSVINELRENGRLTSHNEVKKRVAGDETKLATTPDMSPAAESLVKEWSKSGSVGQSELMKLIELLEDFVQSAPTLSITLAAPVTVSLRRELARWCRLNIDKNILISFQFNTTILGGLVIRHGSHVYDWSFRRQILESRSKFPEVLRRV